MNKVTAQLDSLLIMGNSTRTSNQKEMNPSTAQIGGMVHSYFSSKAANDFKHRLSPGVTYCIYTEYESDENGEYTYFIGEAVKSSLDQDSKYKSLEIPGANYQKITAGPGAMPKVVIDAWQEIWKLTPDELEGERAYVADFEVYDHRAADPTNATVDIYIGVK